MSLTEPARSIGQERVLVDIGVPTLGTSPYLIETIESVFAQTLHEWRLVIVENGPGLQSVREELQPYLDDPRVRHVTTGAVIGRAENWTNLIRTGSAPYHALLHDDDRWGPEYLERRVEFLEENENCGFVFSGYTVIDSDGLPIAKSDLGLEEGVHSSSVMLPALYKRMFIGAPTIVVRRASYEAVGQEYKPIFFTDNEMWMRLAANFDVGYLSTWDAFYRFHTLQDSSERTDLAKESLAVLDAVEDLPVPRQVRNAVRAEVYTWLAFDAIERGDRPEAFRHLASSVQTASFGVVRPAIAGRLLAGYAALGLGERGRRALADLREGRWRSRRRRGVSYAAQMTPIDSTADTVVGSDERPAHSVR